MAILEGDIKLLKSAVMADTTDGGGAMTGTAVIDGQSNNLFPDTSEMDRAFGRVALRKVFGVAHTTDTDTLLGAHAIITDAPDDPLVHCLLLQTPGWADNRTAAKNIIERYLVKGPRLTCCMMDTHYAGSLILRLYAVAGSTDFPAGGDAIVLRTPDGIEQYVRVLRVSYASQQFTVTEGTTTVTFLATVVTCDLGQALAYDFAGPPIARSISNGASYALMYTTTTATGARFYGIKPLAAPVSVGDISVNADGGIFTPLVPAATIETPIIDQRPLTGRASIVSTARAAMALPSVTVAVQPGTVFTAPTAIAVGSVALQCGSFAFTDDSTGNLRQGTSVVGAVDYTLGLITFATTSPSYGTLASVLTYSPASAVSASAYSSKLTVTSANQGLAFTNTFFPLPALGSFSLSYMAQGRWYVLTDNKNGKLSGSDTSYGIGTLNYATGSMAVTLGALPDVGSPLIAEWGDPSAAVSVSVANTPAKIGARIALDAKTKADEILLTWSRGATNYTAATDTTGALTGNASGLYANGVLTFEPTVFPDGVVTVTSKTTPALNNGIINNGGGSYTLTGALPITPGTFSATVLASYPVNVRYTPSPLTLYDINGVVYLRYQGNAEDYAANNGGTIAVGTINYATGALTVNPAPSIYAWIKAGTAPASAWILEYYRYLALTAVTITLNPTFANVSYASGASATVVQAYTPTAWVLSANTYGVPLLTEGMALKVGGSIYTAKGGILRRGWSLSTGTPTVDSAGSVSSTGLVTITALPSDGGSAVTWYNLAQDTTAKQIDGGIFRTASAPLKTGVFQIAAGGAAGSGSDAGVISGSTFTGIVDYTRGVVTWSSSTPVDPVALSYNAVFLQYLPLDASLLGLETARLPLDGKVPIFRSGGLVVIHNTQTYSLPNPLVKGTVYNVGRVRVAAMKVKTASGATVDSTLYTTSLDAGEITFPVGSDLTGLGQPFTVDHRIEDMMVCSIADISGKLSFTRNVTHDYPADTSFASSALAIGDVFARVYNYIEQGTWTGVWSDLLIGAAPLANFNETSYPPITTNKGAITERWALIFTNTTAFNIVGESVGNIGTGSTALECAPLNPATGLPYFTIPALGWGNGWGVGNVYRFNTAACGAPLWVVRTVLQGPATLQDDKFTLAFRGDVDRP
jgi:hypothetical protein